MNKPSDKKRREAIEKLDRVIANMRKYLLQQTEQEKIDATLAIIEQLKEIRLALAPVDTDPA